MTDTVDNLVISDEAKASVSAMSVFGRRDAHKLYDLLRSSDAGIEHRRKFILERNKVSMLVEVVPPFFVVAAITEGIPHW